MILKVEYHNTSLAQHGDQGSKLPEFPTGAIWKAGGTAEVNLIFFSELLFTIVYVNIAGHRHFYIIFVIKINLAHHTAVKALV